MPAHQDWKWEDLSKKVVQIPLAGLHTLWRSKINANMSPSSAEFSLANVPLQTLSWIWLLDVHEFYPSDGGLAGSIHVGWINTGMDKSRVYSGSLLPRLAFVGGHGDVHVSYRSAANV